MENKNKKIRLIPKRLTHFRAPEGREQIAAKSEKISPENREKTERGKLSAVYKDLDTSMGRLGNSPDLKALREERDAALKEVEAVKAEMGKKINKAFKKGNRSERWGKRMEWLNRKTVGKAKYKLGIGQTAGGKVIEKLTSGKTLAGKVPHETWKEYALRRIGK